MRRDPITEESVIAERRLVLTRADGTEADVVVRFGRPTGRPVIVWEVPYEIVGPDNEVRRHVGSGADAVQALTIALMECPMHLDFIKEQGELTNKDGPDLWWPRVMLETIKGSEAAHTAESGTVPTCSFCGKSEKETRLVAGPAGNICICGACTRLACGVLGIALAEPER